MQLSAFVFFAVFGAALARPPPAPADPCPSVRDKLVCNNPEIPFKQCTKLTATVWQVKVLLFHHIVLHAIASCRIYLGQYVDPQAGCAYIARCWQPVLNGRTWQA
ncbi:hypothetical protein CPAR01_09973 [Colletotrichum paranaense]|uniref:Uncharacterized protein n=1 Tax=Colletotrichum paranaense TaxID=1914294 RepID=A0ABQ9SCM9_9PEZI|nr:uncharacterized protein CPAR01_09973 [Colletotrichum paranaense]KAK1533265.1 hypothetical protein CPAR01_09973 [Colletotrichum paranaense]